VKAAANRRALPFHSFFLAGFLGIALTMEAGCGVVLPGLAGGLSIGPPRTPPPGPTPSPTPSPTPAPTPVAGIFTLAPGSLAVPRTNHTATLLEDGTVLVAGGFSNAFNCAALNTCYIQGSDRFNPASGIFASGPKMVEPRSQHTATRLRNGQVLIAGGNNSTGFLAATEVFNPAAGGFTSSGSMAQGRRQHTTTLLSNGKVLVAGGFAIDSAGNKSLASGELYDPAAGTFSNTGVMSTARTDHAAVLLNNGKVLIAGGNIPCTPTLCGTVLNALASAELYDPDTNLFSATGSMTIARFQHTATVLPSGLVVVAGGVTVDAANSQYVPTASIEIYDPATGTFSAGGTMVVARTAHTATVLNNGQILFTGGIGMAGGPMKSAELYTPGAHTSSAVSDMSVERIFHTATMLQSGQVAVIGGGNDSATLGSAEIFK
jgi:hypothetical protein